MKNKLFPMEKNDEASMGPGCVQARNEGLTEGYAYGRRMGLAEGHAKGLAKGLKEGHRAGLKEDLAEGYGKGREDGLAEGQSKIIRLYLEATGFVAGTGGCCRRKARRFVGTQWPHQHHIRKRSYSRKCREWPIRRIRGG